MMKKLDKRRKNIDGNINFKEEQRWRLSSNNVNVRCSSLDFLDTSSDNVTEDMVLDYLAHIIADIYLEQTYGNTTNKESSIILSGVNKGTS